MPPINNRAFCYNRKLRFELELEFLEEVDPDLEDLEEGILEAIMDQDYDRALLPLVPRPNDEDPLIIGLTVKHIETVVVSEPLEKTQSRIFGDELDDITKAVVNQAMDMMRKIQLRTCDLEQETEELEDAGATILKALAGLDRRLGKENTEAGIAKVKRAIEAAKHDVESGPGPKSA